MTITAALARRGDVHFPQPSRFLESDADGVTELPVVAHRAADAPGAAQVLDDAQAVVVADESDRRLTVEDAHPRVGGAEPVLVVNGETGEAEEKHHRESQHGQVDVKHAARVHESVMQQP